MATDPGNMKLRTCCEGKMRSREWDVVVRSTLRSGEDDWGDVQSPGRSLLGVRRGGTAWGGEGQPREGEQSGQTSQDEQGERRAS